MKHFKKVCHNTMFVTTVHYGYACHFSVICGFLIQTSDQFLVFFLAHNP